MEFKYCGKEILLFVSLSKANAIKHLHDIHKKKIFVNFKSYMPWLYNETKSLKRGLRALCIESVWLKQVTYPLWIFVSSTRKRVAMNIKTYWDLKTLYHCYHLLFLTLTKHVLSLLYLYMPVFPKVTSTLIHVMEV